MDITAYIKRIMVLGIFWSALGSRWPINTDFHRCISHHFSLKSKACRANTNKSAIKSLYCLAITRD